MFGFCLGHTRDDPAIAPGYPRMPYSKQWFTHALMCSPFGGITKNLLVAKIRFDVCMIPSSDRTAEDLGQQACIQFQTLSSDLTSRDGVEDSDGTQCEGDVHLSHRIAIQWNHLKSILYHFVAEQDYAEPRHHPMRLLSQGVISGLGHGNVSGTKVVVALVP